MAGCWAISSASAWPQHSQSELYNVPFVVGREVYAYASLVVFAAALFSGLLVRRRIDNLDMIAVLKNSGE